MMHIVERVFLRVLLAWGLVGIVAGAATMLPAWGKPAPAPGERFLAAAGSQFFIWGAIDALLAGLGLRGIGRREAAPLPTDRERERQQKAVRTLHFNARLDWIWIACGGTLLALAFVFPNGRPSLLGHGVGVIGQAMFLLVFDRAFSRQLAAVVNASR